MVLSNEGNSPGAIAGWRGVIRLGDLGQVELAWEMTSVFEIESRRGNIFLFLLFFFGGGE